MNTSSEVCSVQVLDQPFNPEHHEAMFAMEMPGKVQHMSVTVSQRAPVLEWREFLLAPGAKYHFSCDGVRLLVAQPRARKRFFG